MELKTSYIIMNGEILNAVIELSNQALELNVKILTQIKLGINKKID